MPYGVSFATFGANASIIPTHTSGTLFKGNLLDNKPNRDESCVES